MGRKKHYDWSYSASAELQCAAMYARVWGTLNSPFFLFKLRNGDVTKRGDFYYALFSAKLLKLYSHRFV